jgi:hypothetical protein
MHQKNMAGALALAGLVAGLAGRPSWTGWPSRADRLWWRAWLADFSTEIFVRNVAVSTCKYTKYTECVVLIIGLDAHGPGDVNFITQITLTPPGDGAVISLRKYL